MSKYLSNMNVNCSQEEVKRKEPHTPKSNPTLTQLVRHSMTSQHSTNPFSKSIKGSVSYESRISSFKLEFLNYKPLDKEDDEITELSQLSIASNSSKSALKIPSMLREVKEMEDEIKYYSLVSQSMEKKFEMMLLMAPASDFEIQARSVNFPLSTLKYTLFLDLDETLIFTIFLESDVNLIDTIEVSKVNYYDSTVNCNVSLLVSIRPFVSKFLEMISQHYEIIVFTSSLQNYADTIINLIDPNHYVSHRLYRDHCITRDKHYIKDLRIINRNLSKCVLLDDNIISFTSQKDNGVPILNFRGETTDRELMSMCSFLISLSKLDDVRTAINGEFKLSELYYDFKNKKLSIKE